MATGLRDYCGYDDDGPFSSSRLRKLPYVDRSHSPVLRASGFGATGLVIDFGRTLTPVWPVRRTGPGGAVSIRTPVLAGPAGRLFRDHLRRRSWVCGCWGYRSPTSLRALAACLAVHGDLEESEISWDPSRKSQRFRAPPSWLPWCLRSVGHRLLILAGRLPAEQWSVFWNRWWIGDALGALIMTPVLLGLGKCAGGAAPFCDRKVFGKTVLLAAAVVTGCYFVFFRPEASYLLFSVFLLILFSAAWVGPPAARVSALVIAAAAVWATHIGVGAFAGGTDQGKPPEPELVPRGRIANRPRGRGVPQLRQPVAARNGPGGGMGIERMAVRFAGSGPGRITTELASTNW